MNSEFNIATNNLFNLVSLLLNQSNDNLTPVEKSSIYILLDAIKAQTTLVVSIIDGDGDSK